MSKNSKSASYSSDSDSDYVESSDVDESSDETEEYDADNTDETDDDADNDADDDADNDTDDNTDDSSDSDDDTGNDASNADNDTDDDTDDNTDDSSDSDDSNVIRLTKINGKLEIKRKDNLDELNDADDPNADKSSDTNKLDTRGKKRKDYPVMQKPAFLNFIKLLASSNMHIDAIKQTTVDNWLNDVQPGKRRKIRDIAGDAYDTINKIPRRSDILLSKLPFKEKCVLLEEMEILDQVPFMSMDYFTIKKGIFKVLDTYNRMKESAAELELIDSKEEKYKQIDSNDPLKFKILKSNVSDKNKRLLLEKYETLEASHPIERGKLAEWIEWGISITNAVTPLPVQLQDGGGAISRYLQDVKQTLDSKLYGMVKIKERLLELIATRITNPNAKELGVGIVGEPGVGKCLHKDTQLLLYFGGMRSAKNIKRSDILIGDDGGPRIVMSVSNGTDTMYKITPVNNDAFVTNSCHVLTLYNESTNSTIDIPLNEYLENSQSDEWRNSYKLYSVPVEYQEQETRNDPYLIGSLIGACSEKKGNCEEVIKRYLNKKLDNITKSINGNGLGRSIMGIDKTEVEQVLNEKYIPDEYLYNTRRMRYDVFKGFIDQFKHSDGRLNNGLNGISSNSSGLNGGGSGFGGSNDRLNKTTVVISEIKHKRSSSSTRKHVRVGKPSRSRSQSRIAVLPNISKRHGAVSSAMYVRPQLKAALRSAIRKPRSHTAPGTPPDLEMQTPKYANAPKHTNETKTLKPVLESKIPVLKRKGLQIIIEDRILADQFKFLTRSLGYSCLYAYPVFTIFGNINALPNADKKILTDFTVTKLEQDQYYGFTLDGNGRFLLASCIVTHNTHLIQTLATAVNLPFAKINMGGSTDPHHFIGHSYTYEGSTPGVIVKALKQMKSKNGIMYFDEFDKLTLSNKGGLGSSVEHAFLHISDTTQQASFQDQYLAEVEIDLSQMMFIYSFNARENINPILLNRIPIIELPKYTVADKIRIAQDYVVIEALKNVGLNPCDVSFDNKTIEYIINETEADDKHGMRRIKQVIQTVVNKLNILRSIKCNSSASPVRNVSQILSYDIDNFKLPYVVTDKTIKKLNIIMETARREQLSYFV